MPDVIVAEHAPPESVTGFLSQTAHDVNNHPARYKAGDDLHMKRPACDRPYHGIEHVLKIGEDARCTGRKIKFEVHDVSPLARMATVTYDSRMRCCNGTHCESVLKVLLTEVLLPRRLRICWSSVSNRTYRIEKATNLNAGVWSTEAGNIPPTAPIAEHEVVEPEDGLMYYRIAIDTNLP